MSRKREAECARLRKELEDAAIVHDEAMVTQKQKFQGQLNDVQEEMEVLKKAKAK